nr:CorA family divalent cation transporter [Mesorhizobium sp. WSM3626]
MDLIDPDTAEVKEVEGLVGVALPSRENLSEIESSSRLKARDGVLTMSVPIVTHVEGRAPVMAPLGFVLSRERLITIRFATLPAVDAVAGHFADPGEPPTSSLEVFIDLCEELIDRLADGLEQAATDLRTLWERQFSQGPFQRIPQ